MGDFKKQSVDGNNNILDIIALTQSISQDEDDNFLAPEIKVFGLDPLLEIILDYAICEGSELLRSGICALRLVQKSWRNAITNILRKRRQPLYNFYVETLSLRKVKPPFTELGDLLDHFANTIDQTCSQNNDRLPTFRLSISTAFFIKKNYDSICNFFKDCGDGLLELEMSVPENAGSLPCIFPKFSFPFLDKFIISLESIDFNEDQDEVVIGEEEAVVDHSVNVTHLIHSILTGAINLSDFDLSRKVVPSAGFEYLIFPSKVRRLSFRCGVVGSVTGDFELLRNNNSLQNLNSLTLPITDVPIPDELVFKVLDNFKDTLCTLAFIGIRYWGPPRPTTLFRFPLMPNLEEFKTTSINLELEDGLSSLEQYMPNLKSMQISRQTENMFQKWTHSSKYKLVKNLVVKLVDESVDNRNCCNILTIGLEMMQQIHIAFPGLHILELILSPKRTCGLKYLFMEMRQLKELRLHFTGVDPTLNSDFGDALFTGVPFEIIAFLKATPNALDYVDLKTDTLVSIRSLTELTKLSLGTDFKNLQTLISDLAFQYGFLKMPKLKKLCLQGMFVMSEKITKEWKSTGRTLVETFYSEK